MKKELRDPGVVEFSAPIIDAGNGGAFVEFPFNTMELYGTTGRVPVLVEFEGQPYRGSMVRMGTDCHILIILKSIRAVIGKQFGDTVHVKVILDNKPRNIIIPVQVQEALSKNQKAFEKFNSLSYTHQKEYIDWVNDAKREDTRVRRIQQLIEKLDQ